MTNSSRPTASTPRARANTSRMPIIEGKKVTSRRLALTPRHSRTVFESSSVQHIRQLKYLTERLAETEAELQSTCELLTRVARDNFQVFTKVAMLGEQNETLKEENEKLEYERVMLMLHLRNRDEVLGTMSHKLAFWEDRVSHLLKSDSKNDIQDKSIACNLCCEDVKLHKVSWCLHPETPHPICHECINSVMQTRNSNPCTNYDRPITCLSIHEDCEYEMQTTCCTHEGLKYMSDKTVIPVLTRVCDMIRSTPSTDMNTLLFRLAYMQSDGTFRGFECTECGHGPMWNDRCDDLVSHHDQTTNEGTINNACPNCHFMVASSSDMKRWSGELKEEKK